MDGPVFENPENWHGSYYELTLDLGGVEDDERLGRAIAAIWADQRLRGPWNDRNEFGASPVEVPISPPNTTTGVYGCVNSTEVPDLGCTMWLHRVKGEGDYIDLSIPTGMLERVYPVTYPLDAATNPWLRQLDNLFVSIAARVFATIPFRIGWIGEEVGGWAPTPGQMTLADYERGGFVLPEATWRSVGLSLEYQAVPPGVVFRPYLGPHITYGGEQSG